MKGYVRVSAIMPSIKVGNVFYNTESIKEDLLTANSLDSKICVLPELCLTSCNLQSLFLDETILNQSRDALFSIVEFSKSIDMLIIVSLPFKYNNVVYEVAACVLSGKIIGMVSKNFDNKNELNYKYFSSNEDKINEIELIDNKRNLKYKFPFSNKILFSNDLFDLSITFNEKFDDIVNSDIIANISSIPETINIENIFKRIINNSEEMHNSIITASSGPTESTSIYSYFGRSIIVEDGDIIYKNEILSNHIIVSDIDLDRICSMHKINDKQTNIINVSLKYDNILPSNQKLNREFDITPYINKKVNAYNYSMHIINILAIALTKRLNSINSNNIVIGVSGGLDSTIALLVIKKTIEFMSLSDTNVFAISLPGFGTTNNSNNNIKELADALNIKISEINITNAVRYHFNDINHNLNNTNVTFENAQARERMQVLMDIANDVNGIVIGTSDLSEIALGFSTYNGDHMSMYNVNGSLPKTLIRYMLNAIADENLKNKNNELLANVLKNILKTPVSPELLPTENGMLIQKTEELLGNYEIHDFILYNYLKFHYDIEKLYDLTVRTFVYNNNEQQYSLEYVKNCINLFFNKFFKAQYKRTTAPESPYIGLPTLNKCLDFIIPSDTEINFEL